MSLSQILFKHVKPSYLSTSEIGESDVFLQPEVSFEKGQYYLIKAASGRGKSSVLNFLYQNNLFYDGTIAYEPSFTTLQELRTNSLSYVFQDLKLFNDLTGLQNIELKNELTQHKTKQQINDMLDSVGLLQKANQLTATLSLGQQQRIAIIRTLCQPFDFLLLDEPFSHLDSENIRILSSMILSELESKKAGLIVTSLGEESSFKYNHTLTL